MWTAAIVALFVSVTNSELRKFSSKWQIPKCQIFCSKNYIICPFKLAKVGNTIVVISFVVPHLQNSP